MIDPTYLRHVQGWQNVYPHTDTDYLDENTEVRVTDHGIILIDAKPDPEALTPEQAAHVKKVIDDEVGWARCGGFCFGFLLTMAIVVAPHIWDWLRRVL